MEPEKTDFRLCNTEGRLTLDYTLQIEMTKQLYWEDYSNNELYGY